MLVEATVCKALERLAGDTAEVRTALIDELRKTPLFASREGFCAVGNYVPTWWQPREGAPVLVHDCYPRRATIMQQEFWNRQEGMQQEVGQVKNQMPAQRAALVTLARAVQGLAEERGLPGAEPSRLILPPGAN